MRFSQMGFDSGRDASGLAALVVADSSGVNWQGRWLRVRGVPFPEFGPMGELFWRNPAQRDEARAALGRLREKGVKTCIFMRWPAAAWPSGGRKSVGFCGHDEHPVTAASWERGRRQPTGAALRLLDIARRHPEVLVA